MALSRIKVENFKTFSKVDVRLGPFDVLVGANSSGKSNFVSVFQFLRDLGKFGLENAVSMQGGIQYLRNRQIGADKPTSLAFRYTSDKRTHQAFLYPINGVAVDFAPEAFQYSFSLKSYKSSHNFRVSGEHLIVKYNIYEKKKSPQATIKDSPVTQLTLKMHREGKTFSQTVSVPKEYPDLVEGLPFLLREDILIRDKELSIELPGSALFDRTILHFISVYDFDPKLPKRALALKGSAELDEDGTNLSLVLKEIAEDKRLYRRFLNLISDILPFVKDLGVERLSDGSIMFKIRDTYPNASFTPATLLSDGTINVSALICALNFNQKNFTVIEEPERNIHPKVISRVVAMLEETSKRRQILVTTHSPEVVRSAGIERLLFISRNRRGFSKITRPADSSEVSAFLGNDLGVDDLFLQGLLGA